jgi:sigma-B regulation protein RsbU (phosphoserine phosphatase)
LGIDRDMDYRRARVSLRVGDALILTTDGLSEAMNFDQEMFGQERMLAAARTAIGRGDSAEGVAKHIVWEMRRFAGLQDRGDDVTLLVVRVV